MLAVRHLQSMCTRHNHMRGECTRCASIRVVRARKCTGTYLYVSPCVLMERTEAAFIRAILLPPRLFSYRLTLSLLQQSTLSPTSSSISMSTPAESRQLSPNIHLHPPASHPMPIHPIFLHARRSGDSAFGPNISIPPTCLHDRRCRRAWGTSAAAHTHTGSKPTSPSPSPSPFPSQ